MKTLRFLLFFLLLPVLCSYAQESAVSKIADENFKPVSVKTIKTTFVDQTSAGTLLLETDYDYSANSQIRPMIDYLPGLKSINGPSMTAMKRIDGGIREQSFIYENLGNYPSFAIWNTGASYGWGNIRIAEQGPLAGKAIVAAHSGGTSHLAYIDLNTNQVSGYSSSFGGNFPSFTYLNNGTIWATTITDIYKSMDAGINWMYVGPVGANDPEFWGTYTTEVGIHSSENQLRVDMLMAVQRNGDVIWGADPDSADILYQYISPDQGNTWVGRVRAVDGVTGQIADRMSYAPQIENFGQTKMLLDNNNSTHIVANGYGWDTQEGRDVFPVLYKNVPNAWLSITSEAMEKSDANIITNYRPGNGIGNAYPGLSISPDGNVIIIVWQGPEYSDAPGFSPINIYPGDGGPASDSVFYTDLYFSISQDHGQSWTSPEVLKGAKFTQECYPNLAERLEFDGNMATLHYMYMIDDIPGTSLFSENSASNFNAWYYDTFTFQTNIQMTASLDHNTGTVQLTAFDNGFIGNQYNGTGGLGFIYNNSSSVLYTGGAVFGTPATGIKGQIGSFADTTGGLLVNDLVNSQPLQGFFQEPPFDQVSHAELADVNSPNPLPLQIKQSTFSAQGDKFVIYNYSYKNNSPDYIDDFYAGIFLDLDVSSFSGNLGGYLPGSDVIYINHPSGPDFSYYGVVAINGLAGGCVLTDYTTDRYEIFNWFIDNSFTPVTTPNDQRLFVSSGPYNFGPGEEKQIVFAIVAADNLNDLAQQADIAKNKWNAGNNSWNAILTISDNSGTKEFGNLVFGQSPGATDGIDPMLGEEELPPLPPAGAFDIRFNLPIIPPASSLKDIRGIDLESATWTLQFQPGSGGYPMNLNWNPAELPEGSFMLKDPFGGMLVNVDMKNTPSNSFTLTNTAVTSLVIEYSKSIPVGFGVASGWNMVSVPVLAPDMTKTSLFPSATSSAFAFNNGYQTADILVNGKGYWLKFGVNEEITIAGLRVEEPNPVVAGWNMVGPYDQEFPVSQIASDPPGIISSSFFGYDGGYFTANTVYPGKGYWVKCTQAGALIPADLQPKDGEKDGTLAAMYEIAFNVVDGVGGTYNMAAGIDPLGTDGLDAGLGEAELPPAPPAGIFDARFVFPDNV
ncbi:MAG: hypothetical protein K9I71_09760, partial [Ignavibacteriales bacterium]|nr:hypothetical protein [Ignavibacteriales bacterium]MCF8316401.1 hypothetical protein [Ignavibacteriales bacterium]MCF8437641.1 hypothetical protein [Ignavibacteriales bacterium]